MILIESPATTGSTTTTGDLLVDLCAIKQNGTQTLFVTGWSLVCAIRHSENGQLRERFYFKDIPFCSYIWTALHLKDRAKALQLIGLWRYLLKPATFDMCEWRENYAVNDCHRPLCRFLCKQQLHLARNVLFGFSRKFLGCHQIVGNDICRTIFIQFLLAVVDILIGGYKFFHDFESFSNRMLNW